MSPAPSHRGFRHRRASGIVLVAAVAASWLSGCNLGQREMEDTTPHGCAECHVDITHQWQQSAHSIAWLSPEFTELTDQHREESCLPCHASKPLLEQSPGSEPQLRDSHRQFGVDCNVCHQIGCGYAGPYKNLIEAHPTIQDTTRLPCSDFCGSCHRMEHEQYVEQYLATTSEPANSCSGCHMPAYRSRLTQDHILSYIHPKRIVRDHSFPVWDDRVSCGAIELAVRDASWPEPKTVQVRVTLVNRGAGHSIPVGEFGHRELNVRAEVRRADGSVLGEREHVVLADSHDCLRLHEPVEYVLDVPVADAAAASKVRVTVERVDPDGDLLYRFVDNVWSAPAPP
jgi:hypothetical protein